MLCCFMLCGAANKMNERDEGREGGREDLYKKNRMEKGVEKK